MKRGTAVTRVVLASVARGHPEPVFRAAAAAYPGGDAGATRRLGAACCGRIPAVRHPDVLLVPALAWLAYAGWEWLVLTKTPEANIRIDLLLIWPLLAVVTLWAAVRAFRP